MQAKQKDITAMSAEELQYCADGLYARCSGSLLDLPKDDYDYLQRCIAQYFKLTGQPWKPSTNLDYLFQ